jgi:chaperonin GroES
MKKYSVMKMNVNIKNLQKFIVVGDRVLVRPQEDSNKTTSGLYLPAGVAEKERIQSGYVIKVGPGYATATANEDEMWKQTDEQVKYIPLQAKEGDLAIFLRKEAFEIEFEKEKFLIVPNQAILVLIRNDDFAI